MIELHSDSGRKLWESVDLGLVCWTIYPISHLNAHRERSTQSAINRAITRLPHRHNRSTTPPALHVAVKYGQLRYVNIGRTDRVAAVPAWPGPWSGQAATCRLTTLTEA